MTDKWIYLDCDGTFVDLYGVSNWLKMLRNENPMPFICANSLVNLEEMSAAIHKLQQIGYKIGIISWLPKDASAEYNDKCRLAKLIWLNSHLPSVHFDEIHIVKYGTPKSIFAHTDNSILFDDDENNRQEWLGISYDEKNLIEKLYSFLK